MYYLHLNQILKSFLNYFFPQNNVEHSFVPLRGLQQRKFTLLYAWMYKKKWRKVLHKFQEDRYNSGFVLSKYMNNNEQLANYRGIDNKSLLKY